MSKTCLMMFLLLLPWVTFAACHQNQGGIEGEASELLIKYPGPESENDPRSDYIVSLLALALDQTVPAYGGYSLQPYANVVLQNRAFRVLDTGAVDVISSMTTKEREAEALAVRIPLMKGLIGYRVFLMNKARIGEMEAVQDINALKQLSLLQGHDWPDTEILIKNGFRVRPVASYGSMFHMLQGNRFALFPRGILEAWGELRNQANKQLMVEPRHMLVYPAAIYFFVAKSNTCLAQRLTEGLEAIISDGSFDKLLRTHPSTRDAFANINFEQRMVHRLDNPLLPEGTPVDIDRYWFKFSQKTMVD